MPLNDLDTALLQAHAESNKPKLAGLYAKAADQSEARGDIDAACFYLTHAYVFALDAGLDTAQKFHVRLLAYGREE